jgi:hypothetical protein
MTAAHDADEAGEHLVIGRVKDPFLPQLKPFSSRSKDIALVQAIPEQG